MDNSQVIIFQIVEFFYFHNLSKILISLWTILLKQDNYESRNIFQRLDWNKNSKGEYRKRSMINAHSQENIHIVIFLDAHLSHLSYFFSLIQIKWTYGKKKTNLIQILHDIKRMVSKLDIIPGMELKNSFFAPPKGIILLHWHTK